MCQQACRSQPGGPNPYLYMPLEVHSTDSCGSGSSPVPSSLHTDMGTLLAWEGPTTVGIQDNTPHPIAPLN